MKQLSRKFIIIICIIVILFILALLLKPQPEIVKVGPIPKAFNNPTTDLPIKEPRSKEKRENTIPSVVSNKTIYLTFDDGPSYLTNNILDILSQENIPATFFVVGRHLEKYQASLRRAYQDGHTIALHTNTHNYQYIYTSDENYFNDLKAISDKVFNITGQHSRIVRLPGGSSNTVSRKYNKGIITRITKQLTENNYYYFDWNIDSGDASGQLSKEQIYHNTIASLKDGSNIVLMHDSNTKKSTVEALPEIIKYAKEHGYTFAKITKDTLPIRHHINN